MEPVVRKVMPSSWTEGQILAHHIFGWKTKEGLRNEEVPLHMFTKSYADAIYPGPALSL